MAPGSVFITGATGYIGTRLAARLVARGHAVRALVRQGSERKLPAGVTPVVGNALDAASFAGALRAEDTVVQLVGTPHPSPAKAAEFQSVDLASARASMENAAGAAVAHFVYVSVARPAPAMHAYIEARVAGEAILRSTGLPTTILRPWYVLGPGHRWAYVLLPLYWVAGMVPSWREGATRLGMVTIGQMVDALVAAIETPPNGVRIWGVPEIRRAPR
jgi:uncharacterized protein YbjT (DUF2867 family)